MKLYKLLFALPILLGFGSASAQDKSADTTARYFLIQASIGNMQEVAQARIAVDQSTSPDVKAFASKMITDHGNAESQLMKLIESKGIQLPKEATETPQEDIMLKSTPSKDFDRVYVHMMVPGHRQTVAMFEKYAITGKDPVVKAFAQSMLPTLKEHLASIIAIEDKLKDVAAK
jgi:putative membrane protein